MLARILLPNICAVLAVCVQGRAQEGFVDPSLNGGSMLTYTLNTFPPNLGEPLNVIISNQSDPRVLAETMWEGGLYTYLEAGAFGGQCLGLHMGNKQQANLGDGNKNQTQKALLRYQYFHNHFLGTCLETLYGGNHIRVFKQETSGAYFLSASTELDSKRYHQLGINAYDAGRDLFVGNATNIAIKGYLDSDASFIGGSQQERLEIQNHSELHRGSSASKQDVQPVGGEISDGLVAVLTVQVIQEDPKHWSEWVWSALGL
uniref:Ricin B lectin domain-containing protein n=1 Tax=Kwoniella dejecticola CBS 10117 TaxID=1296121 RepID=A0A1A6AF15_9TREE|nr:uncharacterized protein I303_00435 [Kwoniella dejecticola CBS 10117]OBR88618.1 hypothetical protein I303_00435 [Kwoniella dejecticola CBS 10117]